MAVKLHNAVCGRCDGMHSEIFEDSGWRGDCSYFDGTGTCSYYCEEEPECIVNCPSEEGWGEDPGPGPCWDCGGSGKQPIYQGFNLSELFK